MRLVDPEGLCIALAAATRATRATAICQNADGLYLSRRGAEAIIEEEGGVQRRVYLDSAGIPTVGIGHRVLPQDRLRVGQVCQTDRITGWFVHDVRIAEAFVRTLVGDMPVSQEEFDALVDLTFNVGQGNLSRSRSPGLHRAIRNGSYSQVARQLRYTRDASGRSPSGLLRRSQRRENIFRRGDYRAPRP